MGVQEFAANCVLGAEMHSYCGGGNAGNFFFNIVPEAMACHLRGGELCNNNLIWNSFISVEDLFFVLGGGYCYLLQSMNVA